jgi:hypothetical protein
MNKLNMPLDLRMLPIYTSFTKWLIQTGNKDLLISYDEFETKFTEMLINEENKDDN